MIKCNRNVHRGEVAVTATKYGKAEPWLVQSKHNIRTKTNRRLSSVADLTKVCFR